MKKNIPVLILIYVSLALISMKCDGNKTTVIDVNKVCSGKVDSVNNYWHDIVKNLIIPDTVYLIGDSTAIHWIDSVSIRHIDSIRYTDSVRYIEKDSLVNTLGKLVEIKVDSVKTDTTAKATLSPENMIDGIPYISKSNKGTRWAAPGYPHSAMFYFDSTYLVTEIWINVYGWDEDYTHKIKFYYYGKELDNITTNKSLYSKHSLFYVGEHLYMTILSGENNWVDVGEIKVFGYKL